MTETTNNNRHTARDTYSARRQTLDRERNERAAERLEDVPSRTPINFDEFVATLRRDNNEEMASFFGRSTRPSPFIARVPAENRIRVTPPEPEITFIPPPLERVTARRPSIWDTQAIRAENQGIEPPVNAPYIRHGVDFEGDRVRVNQLSDVGDAGLGTLTMNTGGITGQGITINDEFGNRRVQIGANGGAIFSGSISASPAQTGNWSVDSSPVNGLKFSNLSGFEQGIVSFLKEKLTLNVSLSQLSAGIEVKVSLNIADTGEALLSAEDFVKLD